MGECRLGDVDTNELTSGLCAVECRVSVLSSYEVVVEMVGETVASVVVSSTV